MSSPTPEERAAALVTVEELTDVVTVSVGDLVVDYESSEYYHFCGRELEVATRLRAEIARAIAAAVRDERERCARVAECVGFELDQVAHPSKRDGLLEAGEAVARAIRAADDERSG